jgi:hypothetical protein
MAVMNSYNLGDNYQPNRDHKHISSREGAQKSPNQNKRKIFSREAPLTNQSLLELSSDVEELVARGSAWQLASVDEFTKRIKRLKTLDVRLTGPLLSSSNLNGILKTNQLIKNLAGADSFLDASCLNALCAKSIESLNLRSCDLLSPSDVVNFLSRTAQLKELFLTGSLATPEVAIAISKYCPQLEVLDFSNAVNIPESFYLKIAQNCPRLRKISVSCSDHFSDCVLIEFLEKCTGLVKINACRTEITDASLYKIETLNRHIQTINISCCKNITKKGLESLLRVSKDSLEDLNVNGMDIGLWILDLLCTYHPPLGTLNLMSMEDHGSSPRAALLLKTIKKLSLPNPRIREMKIANFHGVDYEVLKKLITLCPTVKAIYASSGQLGDFAESCGVDEEAFRKKFQEECGVSVSRLAY